MATIYSTTGAGDIGIDNSVSLTAIDAELRARGFTMEGFTHAPGDRMPRFDPISAWPDYLVIQVYESEPKTLLFPKSGFYRHPELDVKNAGFLLKPQK